MIYAFLLLLIELCWFYIHLFIPGFVVFIHLCTSVQVFDFLKIKYKLSLFTVYQNGRKPVVTVGN